MKQTRASTHQGCATTGLSAQEKVARLVKQFRNRRRALVLPHDNPDPDSLASAWALATVLENRVGVKTEIAYGGIIGRAENLAFIKQLSVPIVPISSVNLAAYDLLALVDTQQSVKNHALYDERVADIAIDHHPLRKGPISNTFADLGDTYGATSTMLTEYLRAADIEPSPGLATALYYGIKADTRDLERQTQAPDVDCYLWLFSKIDRKCLAAIEHPELPQRYFRLFHQAFEQARVYSRGVITELGEVYTPDMVPEIAERLSFLKGTLWSLALGSFRSQLYLSLRVRDKRKNAGRLIREACANFGGSAGGHGSMAGARLPLVGRRTQREALRRMVMKRFKTTFGVEKERGFALLSDEL